MRPTITFPSFLCLLLASAPLTLALVTPYNATRAAELFSRQSQTCGGVAGLQQCGAGFPSEFCCETGATCIPLQGEKGFAALCCPTGDCTFVSPIDCDKEAQDAIANPENQIHSTDLITDLPKCGTQCCPQGYTCKGNVCEAPSSPAPTPSESTRTPSATQSAPTFVLTEKSKCDKYPAGAIMAGFFPGIVLGVAFTLGFFFARKKRQEYLHSNRSSLSFKDISRQISMPIYDPALANRVDFMRRGSNRSHETHRSTSPLQKETPRRERDHSNDATLVNPYSPYSQNNTTPRGRSTAPRTPLLRSLFNRTPQTPQQVFANTSTPESTRSDRTHRTHGSHRSKRSHKSSKSHKSHRSRTHHNEDPSTSTSTSPTTISVSRTNTSESIPIIIDSHSTISSTNSRTNPHARSQPTAYGHSRPDAYERPPPLPPALPLPVAVGALVVPRVNGGEREQRMTASTVRTTFSSIMQHAGYGGEERRGVREMSQRGR